VHDAMHVVAECKAARVNKTVQSLMFMQIVRLVQCALCRGEVYVKMWARWKQVFIAYV
jgi:hypothetical protein